MLRFTRSFLCRFRATSILAMAGLWLAASGPAGAQVLSKLAERGFTVVPEPQEVELDGSEVPFGPAYSVQGASADPSGAAAESLRDHLSERFGLVPSASGGTVVTFEMHEGAVNSGRATASDRAAIAAQAYRLEIGASAIRIAANAPAGLFYGVQTLAQLLRSQNGSLRLPAGKIVDWPDLPERHIYWDDAHHLDRLPEFKRAIRQAAFFKINGFVLKLEGHFQFAAAPAAVEPYALTPAEYQELTDYALRLHVQLIPYLDGPAHLAFLLKHPEYQQFREFPDSNYEICAVNPGAVRLLSGMFQNLVDANPGGRFVYFSTDEPYYVGLATGAGCPEKEAATQAGSPGRLLAGFIEKIARPLHDQGRTIVFWGEYPLKPGDIDALPSYLVNGEVYGPKFDPVFRKHGIRQMIYTSTQGEERIFPEYFAVPQSLQLHPRSSSPDRLNDGFNEISRSPARQYADLTGAIVAAWADAGLHPETFWLGYVMASSAAWRPGGPSREEAASAFYRVFYGEQATGMNRIYNLMSRQARFWTDSWETGISERKPIFGNSEKIYHPREPVHDQVLPLPPAPTGDLGFDSPWASANARRLDLASTFLAENDELLGLLHESISQATSNRYNLEVFLSVTDLCRQNLRMLVSLGRMNGLLESAHNEARRNRPAEAVESLDRALTVARQIRQERNAVLRAVTATWEKSWFPRVQSANGRVFLHELDDVKDHVPDRTVDMSYLVERELNLPVGAWVEAIRTARNTYAAAHSLAADNSRFDWLDRDDRPVAAAREE